MQELSGQAEVWRAGDAEAAVFIPQMQDAGDGSATGRGDDGTGRRE